MAKKVKLTPWFPRETRPVRDGYYDVRWSSTDRNVYRILWMTGYGWCWARCSPLAQQARHWRGVLCPTTGEEQ